MPQYVQVWTRDNLFKPIDIIDARPYPANVGFPEACDFVARLERFFAGRLFDAHRIRRDSSPRFSRLLYLEEQPLWILEYHFTGFSEEPAYIQVGLRIAEAWWKWNQYASPFTYSRADSAEIVDQWMNERASNGRLIPKDVGEEIGPEDADLRKVGTSTPASEPIVFDPMSRDRINAWLSLDRATGDAWESGMRYWDAMEPDQAFQSLAIAGRGFYNGLDGLSPYDGFSWTVRVELYFASRALALVRAFDYLSEVYSSRYTERDCPLPRSVRRAIEQIRCIFLWMIKRWGWEEIISANGFQAIASRLETFRATVEAPFYRAVLTWRGDPSADRHPYADSLADNAERMGLSADLKMTTDEAKALSGELMEVWKRTPALGKIYPDRTHEEVLDWYSSLRLIETHWQSLPPIPLAESEAPIPSLPEKGQTEPTIASLLDPIPRESATEEGGGTPSESSAYPGSQLLFDPYDLVTLDQIAASVNKTKRTLERLKTKGELPAPVRDGGGGKPDYYSWKQIRPWLVNFFGVILPEEFPSLRKPPGT